MTTDTNNRQHSAPPLRPRRGEHGLVLAASLFGFAVLAVIATTDAWGKILIGVTVLATMAFAAIVVVRAIWHILTTPTVHMVQIVESSPTNKPGHQKRAQEETCHDDNSGIHC